MRTSLIILSLVINGMLLTALASPGVVRTVYSHFLPATTALGSTKAPAPQAGATVASSGDAGLRSTGSVMWGAVDTDDPRQLIDRLRGAGMPPVLIRALVEAKLDRDIATKREALRAANPPPPYWSALAVANPKIDFKAAADLRQAERKKLALLDTELGANTSLSQESTMVDRLKYSDLPTDKTRQVKVIDEDYDELTALVTNGMLGITLPGDRDQLAWMRAEKEKDLLSVLSPEEYESYLLRTSATASSLRGNLATFQPTAEEFRTIFRLQRVYDEKYPFGGAGVASVEEVTARQQDRSQLTEQIKAALGPVRGTEYERETNSGFRQLSQAVAQLGMTKNAAVQAWTVQKEFDQRIAAARADRTLRPADLGVQTNQLRSELTNRLYETLGGQRGLDAYNRTMTQTTAVAIRPLAAPVTKQ